METIIFNFHIKLWGCDYHSARLQFLLISVPFGGICVLEKCVLCEFLIL